MATSATQFGETGLIGLHLHEHGQPRRSEAVDRMAPASGQREWGQWNRVRPETRKALVLHPQLTMLQERLALQCRLLHA